MAAGRRSFLGGSLDHYHPANEHFTAKLRIVKRRIYFNDFFRWIGFEAMANRFSHTYERHFAFIFPVGSILWELEAVMDLPGAFGKREGKAPSS